MEVRREALLAFINGLDTPTLQGLCQQIMGGDPGMAGMDMGEGSNKIETWRDIKAPVSPGKGQIVVAQDFEVPKQDLKPRPMYMDQDDASLMDQAAYNGE